ncbi:MAG: hypothetical protein JW891_13860 [Candidatus Lokiarchaeota archaeon]|nr:hypothetical protein [Candidatus Lokiarchaeota archaeon]
MQLSIEQLAENIVNQNVTNINLISYFKRSTSRTPVFLSQIKRNYAEIRPLLNNGLIKAYDPVKSYEFFIDKLENCFYESYQEKIDFLKEEIWRRKRAKENLIKKAEDLEPKVGDKEYDSKLHDCLEFAKKTINMLDKMELEKEDFNNVIAKYQEKMKEDPVYKLLLYVRNDNEIIFNKRTADNEQLVRKKLLTYAEACVPGEAKDLVMEMKNRGFYKEYSPAKNYYITDLGLIVDKKLKEHSWDEQKKIEDKLPEEQLQEEEFEQLRAKFNL